MASDKEFSADIALRVARLDASSDEAIRKFDASFSQEIQGKIAQIQSDIQSRSGDFAHNNPFGGDRVVGGIHCRTEAEYEAACAKFYDPV